MSEILIKWFASNFEEHPSDNAYLLFRSMTYDCHSLRRHRQLRIHWSQEKCPNVSFFFWYEIAKEGDINNNTSRSDYVSYCSFIISELETLWQEVSNVRAFHDTRQQEGEGAQITEPTGIN